MKNDIDVDSRADGLVWITINRPDKHNPLARAVLDALAAAVRSTGQDPRTRLIVLRGAGDKYFAAGGDLVELAQVRTPEQIDDMAGNATLALDTIRDCEVPVIAYLNGDAIGGGAELASACDMRLMASHARIGFIQGRLGISSAWGGGPDLCMLVGPARAMRMMSRCEMIGVQTALDWGLAELEVRDGPQGEDIKAFLKPMLDRSRLVLQGIKQQTAAWRKGMGQPQRREVERSHVQTTWASTEHWDAVERFLSKEKS